MAKEQKSPEPAPALDAAPEVAGPPKSYRLQIMLGFVSLVLFQLIVLVLAVSALTKQVPTQPGLPDWGIPTDIDTPSTVPPGIGQRVKMSERSIGEAAFKVKVPDGEDQVTFTVRVHVLIRERDERAFDKQYLQYMHTIEDKVTTVLKASTREERKEAASTAIKQRIKREINRVLDTPLVQDVLVTESNFETQ